MIIRMKKTLVYFCCLFFLFFNLQISDINAQSIKVTGKVVSSDGRGLELATITLKGAKDAAVTNAEGVFSINANKSSTLIFSAIGYKSFEAVASAAYFTSLLSVVGNFKIMDNPRVFKSHNLLWPIPQAELDVNKNPGFKQNPGY
jgi:hypothetical protein